MLRKNVITLLGIAAFILFGVFGWASIIGRLQDPLVEYYGQTMTQSDLHQQHRLTGASPSLHCVQLTNNPFAVMFICFNTLQEANAFMEGR